MTRIDYSNFNIGLIRKRYPRAFLELRKLFIKEDPMGFFRFNGIPATEYDPEIATILLQIDQVDSFEETLALVHNEFINWFDEAVVGPREKYHDISRKIYEWKIKEK